MCIRDSGKGATVEVTAAGKVLTIIVKGNDIADNAANYHTYTLTFKGGVGVEQNIYNLSLIHIS